MSEKLGFRDLLTYDANKTGGLVSRWMWVGCTACSAAFGITAIGQQMDQIEGLRGVETAKLSPLQTFGVTQYRRALTLGELVRVRVATLNLQVEDETVLSEEERKAKRARQKEAILGADADLIALQELNQTLAGEVQNWLGSGYRFKGADSMQPERNGFFYRISRLAPVEVVQLPIPPAEHPVISGRWRVVPDEIEFKAIHCHLPPHDPVKRQKQAEMIVREIRRDEGPVVLLGDLNTWPFLPQDRRVLYYDGPALLSIFRTGGLVDAGARTLFGHIGASGDLTFPGRDGKASLTVALSRVLCNISVEPILTAIPEQTTEIGDEREILVADLGFSVEMPLPGVEQSRSR